MAVKKKFYLRNLPINGDALVDLIFQQFVILLRGNYLVIERRSKLIDEDTGKHIYAITIFSKPILILIDASRMILGYEVVALIHELSHIWFYYSSERYIRRTEKILMEKFTDQQKRVLESFIPPYKPKNCIKRKRR